MKMLIFFFNDTATTEIYTLSLHDALPICVRGDGSFLSGKRLALRMDLGWRVTHLAAGIGISHRGTLKNAGDRKSTRLNSSHGYISYAVFFLKKKKMGYDATPFNQTLMQNG